MSKQDNSALDQDALAYAEAVQTMYDCIIVLKLTPGARGSSRAWCVYAVAYLGDEELPQNAALQVGVSYPSRWHKTFSGAALKALYNLEESLRAYYTLKGMRFDVG